MAIVLIGVPGAGKTTVGALLAQRLNLDFVDSDEQIEKQTGKTISDIFVQDGEITFREIEKEAISEALSGDRIVLSVGGGALMNEETRSRIKNHTVIWLKTGLTQAVDRIGMNRNRPLLLGNVRGQLADLMVAREPYYIECAKFAVDTNSLNPMQVVDEILIQMDGPVNADN